MGGKVEGLTRANDAAMRAYADEMAVSEKLAHALRLAWDVEGTTTKQAAQAYRAAIKTYNASRKEG